MTIVFAVIRVLETFAAPFYYLIAFFSNRKRIPPTANVILTTSATVLARKIRARELTCKQVVSAFVERCKEVNPIVNAIVEERYEDALADAEKADKFLATTRLHVSQSQLQREKPLLGIPITIKECCSMKGMIFSTGVKRYEKRKAAYNGDAVQSLIKAGAIPIAVTSTPAYSLGIETFNDLIGYTANPYDSRKSSGGSSGGEIDLQYIRIYHSHQFQRIFFAVDRTLSDKISQAATHFETQHNCLVKQINVEEFHKIPEISLTHFQKMTVLATEKDISTREARNCGNGVIKNILKLVANGWLKNIWAMSDESYTKQIHNLKTKLSELLGSNGVLLMPTWSESACYRYQSLSKTYNICYDYFTNALDLASTAVPVGYDCNDMPLSIQVVAARGCDHLCFKVAQELENLFGGWIPPYEHA
ncbi:fatty-acid amide hydrolase 2-B-like isoform X2 [Planococcus citri]|uniref:fatty-acid amide hydrolase 2-B-like isoform X2 n=1 Tax=Planococcus citri TaxID=170843 RepID=UPI0031F8DB64